MPLPKDDPYRRRPDITLAQEKLDWTPSVDLEKGLRLAIAYFDEALRSERSAELRVSR
jgi:UDP-glucuronate decarboxylase